jgi:hypothetical protein
MISVTNAAFLRLSRRAEANARNLIETFVDVGPLFALLSSSDHQIMFGRRGTGKTHALSYLATDRELKGDAVAMIDLRKVGSSGGMYNDPGRSLQERATALLVDVLTAIHEALYTYFVGSSDTFDLAVASPALDALAVAITAVTVDGETEIASKSSQSRKATSGDALSASLGAHGALSLRASSSEEQSASDSAQVRRSGHERLYVNFGSAGVAFQRILDVMKGRHLWILLDEWSSIPLNLQPYLADLLRRSVFPISGATVKIAAIEQRSNFRLHTDDHDYVGIEIGADASADVSLDDFMIFENDQAKAETFLRTLIARHVGVAPEDTDQFVSYAFEENAFAELVRAAEGVPRDAMNILVLAAQRAIDSRITVADIRLVARTWYQRDKEKAVSFNPGALRLLQWMVEEIVGRRRARAFMLRSGTTDPLIDTLCDARVVHVIKRGVSPVDRLGTRFDVYKLDYGCYAELLTTDHAPLGLVHIEGEAGTTGRYVDAPPADYHSIGHAILSLDRFYQTAHPAGGVEQGPKRS